MKDLEYQFEVKMQAYNYLEKERDKLYEYFNDAVYAIQQKEGLGNLILEKKIVAVN